MKKKIFRIFGVKKVIETLGIKGLCANYNSIFNYKFHDFDNSMFSLFVLINLSLLISLWKIKDK